MNCTFRLLMSLVVAGALVACDSKPDADDSGADRAEPPEEAAPAPAPALALLDACKIRMTQPDAREWQTKWDPAHTRPEGANPSGVRSVHWANEQEMKSEVEMGNAVPFDLVCGNDRDQ